MNLQSNMTPNKIFPQPNLLIYLNKHVIVTINSVNYGVVAVVTGMNGNQMQTEKFVWKDEDLQSFVNSMRLNIAGDTTISTVLSYNDGDSFSLYDRSKELVKLTKREIAEKFGIIEECLEII